MDSTWTDSLGVAVMGARAPANAVAWARAAEQAGLGSLWLVEDYFQPGAFALAHNVATRDDVQPTLDRLAGFGGRVLRPADAPPHGGWRGYVADPDDHAWEIAWNPAWPISPEGLVTFGT